jgi:hypothetical protein
MTYYLLCSSAFYTVLKFDTYEEALAQKEFLRLPGFVIFKAELVE